MKKYRHYKGMSKKSWALLISVAVLLAATVGGTVAYLFAGTGMAKENKFQLGSAPDIPVIETIDGNVKRNVGVKNNAAFDVYVRANVVVTWYADEAHTQIVEKPAAASVTYSALNNNWFLADDGYYYCKAPVRAGQNSPSLFESITVSTGYQADVTVMAQAIQATPAKAVEGAWDVSVNATTGIISK